MVWKTVAPAMPFSASMSGLDGSDQLDLDSLVQRKRGGADCRSCMLSAFAEQLGHQVGESVHDLWLLGESGCAVDESQRLDQIVHAVKVAEVIPHAPQDLYSGRAGGQIRIVDAHFRSDLAAIQDIAVVVMWTVAGNEQQVAVLTTQQEPRPLGNSGPQLDSEAGELVFHGSQEISPSTTVPAQATSVAYRESSTPWSLESRVV